MILDLPIVQAALPRLLGGEAELGRDVRWVHVSEIRDLTDLLAGSELVLTTGLELDQDPDRAGEYLSSLERSGASGVLIELAGDRHRTFEALRVAAGSVAMPVIVLERRVRFVEITEIVHRMIVAEQLEIVERSRDVHEVFTLLSLENAGTEQIVRRAAEMIGAPVVLEDLSHLVLAYSTATATPQVTTTALLRDWERRSRITPSLETTGRTGPECWLLTPVGIRQQMWGRLIVPVIFETDSAAAMVLERAAQTLAIGRLAERDQRELSQQAQAGLLNTLRQPRGLTGAEASARASALGLKPSASYVPVVFRLAGPAQRGDPLAGQQEERSLLDRLATVLKAMRGSALTASIQSGAVGMILAVPAKQLEDPILQRIADVLSSAPGTTQRADQQESTFLTPWVMGVGRARSALLEAAAGIDEADHIAETASTLGDSGKRFFRATDIRLRGLLALLRHDPRVQSFVESELEGVLRADAAHGNGSLLELLQLFLESGGNKAAMARGGFLSRPSLYARLDRLEKLLGVPLSEPESRTSLHVALLLHQLRGI